MLPWKFSSSIMPRSLRQISGRRDGRARHIFYLIPDSHNGSAIIETCQLGWSPYRLPRLERLPLILALQPLNLLLATLPRNRSNHRPRQTRHPFADTHPLNPYVSHLYKNGGGGGGFPYQFFIPFQFSELAGGFLPPEAFPPQNSLCYT